MALAVRLWGIGFGLPYLYHADEQLVVHHALAFGSGDLNPHYFRIPPFVSYLLFFLYALFFIVAKVFGWVHSALDFGALFLKDPTPFYLLGRGVFGALIGTLTVYFMYRVVLKFFSRPCAYLTTFFFAFNFLHVQNSHYIYLDMPLLAILVVCFFPILNVLNHPRDADYWWFGALAGLAIATKYNGSFIAVPFFVAHLLSQKPTWRMLFSKRLFYSLLAALISFSIANPYAWLDAKTFFEGVFAMRQFQGVIGLTPHVTYSLNEAMGIPLLASGILGMLFSALRRERSKLPFVVFVAGYYAVLTRFSQPHDRYVLPLVPFLLFFAADFLLRIAQKLRMKKWAIFILATLALSPCLLKVCLLDRLLGRGDVRTIAGQWIEQNIPPGKIIAFGEPFFLPKLRFTRDQLAEKKKMALSQGVAPIKIQRIERMLDDAERNPEKSYVLYFMVTGGPHEFLFTNPSIPYDASILKDLKVQYVLFPKIFSDVPVSFYEWLRKDAELIQRFSPYRDLKRDWPIDPHPLTGAPSTWQELIARERNGQIIEIYRLFR